MDFAWYAKPNLMLQPTGAAIPVPRDMTDLPAARAAELYRSAPQPRVLHFVDQRKVNTVREKAFVQKIGDSIQGSFPASVTFFSLVNGRFLFLWQHVASSRKVQNSSQRQSS